eukprot:TRINITY_DN472_c0_g2_i6.p1 TRINITY_DN472_c0_g2~~TRINITY_DN472_c0_g2_i6.p1  ORF type:complete len:303 (-),score=93.17 TRINITY_DN472_c0_g2_i6:173-1081(-)
MCIRDSSNPLFTLFEKKEGQGTNIEMVKMNRAGVIFIGVKYQSGLMAGDGYGGDNRNMNDTTYKISTQLYVDRHAAKDAIRMHFFGGQFAVKRTEPEKFEVTFPNLRYMDQDGKPRQLTNDENILVNYKIVASRDPNYLNFVARCGDLMQEDLSYGTGIDNLERWVAVKSVECKEQSCTREIETEIKDAFEAFWAYHFAVTAQVFVKNESIYQEVFYDDQVVDTQPITLKRRGGMRFWFIFGYGLAAILAGVLFLYWRRYKSVNKRLQFELTDVRNVAGLRLETPPSNRGLNRYDNLQINRL